MAPSSITSLRALDELLARGCDIDHQVLVGLSPAHHCRGGDHREHHLLGQRRFHTCAPGNGLGTGDHLHDAIRHCAGVFIKRVADQERSPGPAPPGLTQRSAHEGRSPTGRNPQNYIFLTDFGVLDDGLTIFLPVLHAFGAAHQRLVATGDQPHDHAGISTVGGWALGSVEYAEASGSTSANVKQATASAEGIDDAIDDRAQLVETLADGIENRAILGVDEIQDLTCRRQVDLAGAWISGFGAQATQELEESAIVQGGTPGSTARYDGQRMMTTRPMSLRADPAGPSTLIR